MSKHPPAAYGGPIHEPPADATPQQLEAWHEFLEEEAKAPTAEELAIKQWEECQLAEAIAERNAKTYPAIAGITLLMETDVPTEAYVPEFIYTGALNALVGSPKAGKSTIVWSMLLSMMRGQPFIGHKTVPGKVLYITEQSKISFKKQMKERLPQGMYEAIVGHPRFMLMTPREHWTEPVEGKSSPILDWPDRLDWWTKAINAVHPSVFVIDTFNQYAAYDTEGGENDNANVAARMLELNNLKRDHPALAVLLLCHTNKAASARGKGYLDLVDIRGGSAFAGAMDHVVLLNRLPTPANQPPSRERYVHLDYRMTEESKFMVEWQPDGSYLEVPEGKQVIAKPKVESKLGQAVSILLANPKLQELSGRHLSKRLHEAPYQLKIGPTTTSQALNEVKGKKPE